MWPAFWTAKSRWEVEPGAQALLERVQLLAGGRPRTPRPTSPEERPDRGAQLIKRSSVRTVWRVTHGDRDYYVKSYHPVGAGAWLARRLRWLPLVRPGKGWRECRQLKRLRDLGVNCPRPVICGEGRVGGGPWLHLLVTEAIAHARLLSEQALDADLGPAGRRRLAWEFGRWLRQLHDAGIYHDDFHGGNVLVSRRGEGFGFALVDVDRTRVSKRLSRRRAEEMLAAAEAFVQHAVPASVRLLVLKGYLGRPGRLGPEGRQLAQRVWRRSRRRLERFWKRRALRARHTNRQFVVGRAGRRRFALRAGCARGLVGELLTDPEQLLMLPDVEVLKSTHRATTVLVRPPAPATRGPGGVAEGEAHVWVVKRFEPPGRVKRWASLVRPSRARRAWQRGNEMLVRLLAVPTPVAAVEVRRWGMLREAYFVSEAVVGDRLLEFVREHGFDPEVLWKLGQELRALHDRHFYHQDLKANNILVSGPPGDRQVWIIDVESVRRPWGDSRRRRLKQLGRLWRHLIHVRSLEEEALRTFLGGYLRPSQQRDGRLDAWLDDLISEAAPARTGVSPPRRVLLVKPSSLGDVIHALPVAVALKEAFPGVEVDWVVGRPYAELVAAQPAVERTLLFERRRWGGWGFWHHRREWRNLVARLREAKYDVAIDLQGLARSAALTRASRAPARVGLTTAREFGRFAYTVAVRPRHPEAHAVDRYLQTLRALGVTPPAEPRFELAVPEHARRRVDALLAEELVAEEIVCVAPGARWETKRWPAERFAQVAAGLARCHGPGGQDNVRVIVVGTEDDAERARVVTEGVGEQALDWTGRTSLVELAALLERSALLLTNDSGPMHLAAAVGTPLVAVFGPTNPSRTGPYGERAVVVTSAAHCAPCYRRQCERLVCLREVRVESVLHHAQALLRGEFAAQRTEAEQVEVP